jgi:hypothetical protein
VVGADRAPIGDAGKLIAHNQGQQNPIKSYWNVGKRRNVAQIFRGTLEKNAPGEVTVVAGTLSNLLAEGEGRQRAKAPGVHMGRPPSPFQQQAIKRREAGETLMDVARSYSVSYSTISRLGPL